MASLKLSFLLYALISHKANGETVSCQGLDPCACDPSATAETCTLDCTGQAVCQHRVLICRDGDPCIINCSKRRACQNAQITCPANSDCTIHCITPADVCDGKSGGEFNVTLNQAKTYQCISGQAPNKGVCPDITQPGVPAPFTASPTGAPTISTSAATTSIPTTSPVTSEPTANEQTLSPSTEAPTTASTITEAPTSSTITSTQTSTSEPSTTNPSKSPTVHPSTTNPTEQPTASPVLITSTSTVSTNQPMHSTSAPVILNTTESISTSTVLSNTVNPTTANRTLTTSTPTTAPVTGSSATDTTTSSITDTTTTQMRSTSATTLYPTTYCSDWEITLIFDIPQYPQNNQLQNHLQHIILDAFHITILLQFNDTWYDHDWCVNIDIDITLRADRRRRLLEEYVDVTVRTTFIFNDELHDDYFDEYDTNEFGAEFHSVLMNEMGQNVDAFVVMDPIQVSDTPAPTYPPHELQTRHAHHGRQTLIIVMCSIFGACCVIVCIFSCSKWYKHEIAYEKEYNKRYNQHRKYLQVAPTTPSVNAGGEPVTPVVEIETVQTKGSVNAEDATNGNVTNKNKMATLSPEAGQKETEHLDKQTSFEKHLVNSLVKENSLMGHIINDINLQDDVVNNQQ